MKKELLGRKKFYLLNNPSISLIASIYVIEVQNRTYQVVTLDNGDSFPLEERKLKSYGIKDVLTFVNLEGKTYTETPTQTVSNVNFYFCDGKKQGIGNVRISHLPDIDVYAAEISFFDGCYCNGEVRRGNYSLHLYESATSTKGSIRLESKDGYIYCNI